LIVGDEEEIEKLNQNPVISLTDIGPSVVLASSFETSFTAEVVGMLAPPKDNHPQHNLLTGRHWHTSTFLLMIKIVDSISNRQQRPESVDPGVFTGELSQDKADCGDDETPHEGVLHAGDSTIVAKLESGKELKERAKVLHLRYCYMCCQEGFKGTNQKI
jgi:hypothetical protein